MERTDTCRLMEAAFRKQDAHPVPDWTKDTENFTTTDRSNQIEEKQASSLIFIPEASPVSAVANDCSNMYKTPQELFSSFKIPDITDNSGEKKVDKDVHAKRAPGFKSSAPQTSSTDFLFQTEISKHRKIQPNIRMPTSGSISSPPSTGTPKILHTLPAIYASNEAKSLYFPTSNHSGHVLYVDPIFYGYQNPNLLGFPGPYFSALQGLQTCARLASSAEHQKSPDVLKYELNSPGAYKKLTASNSLIQNVSTVQSQMAAAHIPLCLVQDAHGKLHQLVYTVPAHLYEEYIRAAKKTLFHDETEAHDENLEASKNALSRSKKSDVKSKTKRPRKREKFFMFPRAKMKKKSAFKLNDKELYLSATLKRASEAAGKVTNGIVHADKQTELEPSSQLSISSDILEPPDLANKETENGRVGTLYGGSWLSSSCGPREYELDIQNKDFKELSCIQNTGSGACKNDSLESLNSQNLNSNAKVHEALTSSNPSPVSCFGQETKASSSIAVKITGEPTLLADNVVAERQHDKMLEEFEGDYNLHCEVDLLDIDAIINADAYPVENPVMEELVACLKSRLKEVEGRIIEEASYNLSVSENVPVTSDSPRLWTTPMNYRSTAVLELGSDTVSTFNSEVRSYDPHNDFDAIISDLSCHDDDIPSVDTCSTAPLSVRSCTTNDSGISTIGSFVSACTNDSVKDDDAFVECSPLSYSDDEFYRQTVPSNLFLGNDKSIELSTETDFFNNKNEAWTQAAFDDDLKDNFFGCDGISVPSDYGWFQDTSLAQGSERNTHSPSASPSELGFLDHLIEGL